MKNVICFLCFVFANSSSALVPIEGLIFGNVEDIKQYDPFAGTLSFDYSQGAADKKEIVGMSSYYALYKQGTELLNKCEVDLKVNYSSRWKMGIATRSIAGTLQYIGLDLSLKAIVQYAKKLEYTQSKFNNLVSNLVGNTCSQNVSVYSLKLLKNNFHSEWKKTDNVNVIPSMLTNPFFPKALKKKQDTLKVTKREFDYTLRNFRAFCSWNSDSSDYRMLVPYLKNPYIMSFIYNNMRKKKIEIDKKTKELILVKNEKGIQVGCEDLICRNRTEEEFKRIYPRMIGSTDLVDDFTNLYCDHFSMVRYERNTSNKRIKKWLSEQSVEEPKVEALHFLSLMTSIPDPILIADNYQDLSKFFRLNIKNKWDRWSDSKLSQFHNEHLYEEPLEIKLLKQNDSEEIRKGNFNLLFDIGLSEIDRVLDGVDKIDATFSIEIPVKYLAYLKEKINFYRKKSMRNKLVTLERKFVQRIKHQMDLKKHFFKIPIWNDDISEIMANEIIIQINNYRGARLNKFSSKFIKIPVRFRFGVFALQYIRQRFKFKEKEKKALTFN